MLHQLQISMQTLQEENLMLQHKLQQKLASLTEEHRLQELALADTIAAARAAELKTDKLRLDLKRSAHRLQAGGRRSHAPP